MTEPRPSIKVVMVRDNLENIPHSPLHAGFILRSYQPGDAATWTHIWQTAEHGQLSRPDLFRAVFGHDETTLQARLLFLCAAQGQAVGTATAWYDLDYHGENYGRIHYVAILPAFRGRGFAKPLLAAACHRLVDLGHKRVYLVTETHRHPAIHLYLAFGFRPEIRNDHDRLAWANLREQGLPIPS